MATVQRASARVKRNPRQLVLRDRPYHPWRLIPLASTLIELGYTDAMRNRIVDFVEDGGFLESLVVDGTLEPEDLEAARHALESGRAWWARYSARAVPADAAIVPPELTGDDDGTWPGPTALPDGSPVHGDDREVPGDYEPTEADWAAIREADEERDRIDRTRAWIDANPFDRWLEANGGPRD